MRLTKKSNSNIETNVGKNVNKQKFAVKKTSQKVDKQTRGICKSHSTKHINAAMERRKR